jgi:hypothetical protein
MNVAVQRQVTGVLVFLPADEAEQFIKNPRKVQEEVGAMMRGTASMGQDDIESMARLVIGDRATLALPAPKKGKAFRNYPRGAKKGPKPIGRVNCPECGKPMLAGQGLASHRARMHGVPGAVKTATAAAQARRDARAVGG